MTKTRLYVFSLVVLPMILSGIIYVVYRPEETVISSLFGLLGMADIANYTKAAFFEYLPPNWFIYSLPGGLWLFAFQSSIVLLLQSRGPRILAFLISASFVGIGLEILQYFHFTDGRFDPVDLWFYAFATLVSLFVWRVNMPETQVASADSAVPYLQTGLLFIVFSFSIYLADIA